MHLEPGVRVTARNDQHTVRTANRTQVLLSPCMPVSVPIAQRGGSSDLIVNPTECSPPTLYSHEARLLAGRVVWSAQVGSGVQLWPPTKSATRAPSVTEIQVSTTVGAITLTLLGCLNLGDVRTDRSGAQTFQAWASYYTPELWDRVCSNGSADTVAAIHRWLVQSTGVGLSTAQKQLFSHMFMEPK